MPSSQARLSQLLDIPAFLSATSFIEVWFTVGISFALLFSYSSQEGSVSF